MHTYTVHTHALLFFTTLITLEFAKMFIEAKQCTEALDNLGLCSPSDVATTLTKRRGYESERRGYESERLRDYESKQRNFESERRDFEYGRRGYDSKRRGYEPKRSYFGDGGGKEGNIDDLRNLDIYYPQLGIKTPFDDSHLVGNLLRPTSSLPTTPYRGPKRLRVPAPRNSYPIIPSTYHSSQASSSSSTSSNAGLYSSSSASDLTSSSLDLPKPSELPEIIPVLGKYSGIGEKLLFGTGESKYRLLGPADAIRFIEDVRDKREQRKRSGSKTVKFISNAAGDLAGILVGEAARKVGDLAGDITRFGVKEFTSFFINSLVRIMTHLAQLQTATNVASVAA